MRILKKRSNKSRSAKSSKQSREKEEQVTSLCQQIEALGFTVRREQLKRGNTWRVQSGVCRHEGEKLFFLDRRLGLDEQIEFIQGQLAVLSVGNSSESDDFGEVPVGTAGDSIQEGVDPSSDV